MKKDVLMKDLQAVELEMLKDVAKYCEENGIEYFINSGTLLGAVRHGGFIPWDDDIDIGMNLSNYKKFLKYAKKDFPKRYFVQNFKTDSKHCYPWTKIRINGTTWMDPRLTNVEMHSGISMDIFLFNGIAKNAFRRKLQYCAARIQRTLLKKYYFLDGDVKQRHSNLIYKLMPEFIRRPLLFILESIIDIDCAKTDYCYNSYFSGMVENQTEFKSDMFLNLEKIKFEDTYVYAPKDYISYLEIGFGDWQTLPPEEERIGHGDLIVDLEKDYTEYIGDKLKNKRRSHK